MVSFAIDKRGWKCNEVADAQVIQKILPKLHGSRRKIEPVLCALAEYCLSQDKDAALKVLSSETQSSKEFSKNSEAVFPRSYKKLVHMIDNVRRDQFVSFIQ